MSFRIEDDGTVTTIRKCPFCGNPNTVTGIPQDEYGKYMSGELLQNSFPSLDASQREGIHTGIHSECWDKLFSEDES